MARKLILPWLALVALAAGCKSTPKPEVKAEGAAPAEAAEDVSAAADATLETKAADDEEVVQVDFNGDNRPDVYKYYPKGQVPKDDGGGGDAIPPLRKAVDLNGDGRIDMWTWYNRDGSHQRQAFDLDFDGKVDEIVFFEKTLVVRKELYHAFADKPDTFKYYEKGKLARIERDRNGDGKVDTWEYWEGDQIDRIAEDNNSDGQVDKWIKKARAQQ